MLQHEDAGRVDLQRLVVDARVEIVDVLEHDGPAGVLQQTRAGGGRLDDGAVGTQVAAQHGDAAVGHHRVVATTDDHLVVAGRLGDVLAHRPPGDGQRVAVDQIAEFAQHCREPAGVVEVLHQELARRHQVDQARHLASESVPVVEREIDADPSGDGQQVDHRVGGAAHGVDRPHRVLEGGPGEDLRRLEVVLDHLHDAIADQVRES